MESKESVMQPSSDEYFLGSSPAYSLNSANLSRPGQKAADPTTVDGALASYAVAASSFLPPFARASKMEKLSININESDWTTKWSLL